MRRLGELRWRVIGGEVEVEVQDQVNRWVARAIPICPIFTPSFPSN